MSPAEVWPVESQRPRTDYSIHDAEVWIRLRGVENTDIERADPEAAKVVVAADTPSGAALVLPRQAELDLPTASAGHSAVGLFAEFDSVMAMGSAVARRERAARTARRTIERVFY